MNTEMEKHGRVNMEGKTAWEVEPEKGCEVKRLGSLRERGKKTKVGEKTTVIRKEERKMKVHWM